MASVKNAKPANLFALPVQLPPDEVTEILLRHDGVRVEKIISTGQASPPDFWYDQAEDEWVAVLQGEAALQWEDGSMTVMRSGAWLLIPAHKKHRVHFTSQEPPCIWLALFLPQGDISLDSVTKKS